MIVFWGLSPCIMCVRYLRGVQHCEDIVSTVGGILSTVGMLSTVGVIIINAGIS